MNLLASRSAPKPGLLPKPFKTYVAVNEWQTKTIRDAVDRANRRDARFVSHQEVDAWLASWGTRKERKPPL